MAYTNAPFSLTDPPGSQAANTADDELRQLRLDLQERLDDLVEDFINDDPIHPLSATRIFPWTAGVAESLDTASSIGEWNGSTGSLLPLSLTVTPGWVIPILLPVGVTITDIDMRVFRDDAASALTMTLYKVDSTGSRVAIAGPSAATSIAGWHTFALLNAGTEVVVDDTMYYVLTALNANDAAADVKLLWAKVTYTRTFALQGI